MSAERFDRLRAALAARDADAYLTASWPNHIYFTGCLDGHGPLLVLRDGPPQLWVDAMTATSAREEAEGCEVREVSRTEGFEGPLIQELRGAKARRLIVEEAPQADALREALSDCTIEDAPLAKMELRRRKEPRELELLRTVAGIVQEGAQAAREALRVGATELDAVAAGQAAVRRRGSESDAFTWVCSSGPRSYYADARVGHRRLEAGDIGFYDFGIRYHGYIGDICWPFVLGEPTAQQREILEAVAEAQERTLAVLRPGVSAREVHATAAAAFAERGWEAYFPHHAGHGLGLDADPPMLVPESDETVEAGDVLTLEPGVYIPGRGGARLEHTYHVTDDGVERWTTAPSDPAIEL
jgi:Xaa-Pro aminopeptidase